VLFDGGNRVVGSSPPPQSRYEEVIARLRPDSAVIAVTLEGEVRAGTLEMRVGLGIPEGEGLEGAEDAVVRALIYEDSVQSGGREFQHVVRALLEPVPLEVGEGGEATTVIFETALDPSWAPERIHLVAWVQNGATNAVYNAALAPLRDVVPVERTSWGRIKVRWGSGFENARSFENPREPESREP
jgi:hypothetical protein